MGQFVYNKWQNTQNTWLGILVWNLGKKTSELKLKSYKLNPQKLMFLKGLRTSNPCGPPQLLVWAVLEAVQGREAREKVSLGLSFIGLPDEQPRCMIKMIWVTVWAPCHLQPMVWVPFPPSRAEQYLWGLVLVAGGCNSLVLQSQHGVLVPMAAWVMSEAYTAASTKMGLPVGNDLERSG